MQRERTRRDVLRLGALAGVGMLVDACTSGSGHSSTSPSAPSTSGATTATTAPSTSPISSTAAKPTYTDLQRALGDRLARPGQSRYRPGALLYNPRFAGQTPPQAIAYCSSARDVAACVRFAAEGGAPLRIRNGGHSYGGWSSGPGLVVDLAAMNFVRIDTGAKTAIIGAGALLADVYEQLAAKGASIGAGSCATVGVTGLTLGGGVGLLTRAYGLTCDQLASAEVVTADGNGLTVSATENPDLFFALRGGGGGFGAVTALTFHVRPAPQVKEVFLQWPASAAADVLAAWQDWAPKTPRELWSTCKILARPGQGVRAVVAAFWTGDGSPDAQINALLRATPAPAIDSPSSDGYGAAMLGAAGCNGTASACISAALTPAQRLPEAAASSILQRPLPDSAISALTDAVTAGLDVAHLTEGGVSFDALGGAVSDVAADASAFPWRSAIADIQYTATWPFSRAAHAGSYDAFVQRLRATLTPHLGDSGYANYADPSLRDFATAYWGANLPRLQQIRRAHDPHGVFSSPQAVPL